jgi:hypothetical protein
MTRHQRGFKQFTRPVFPSPTATRMERAAASAFPRASHPADQEPDDARQGRGQAIEHGPRTTLYVIDLASNPTSFTRGVRPRVAPINPEARTWHCGVTASSKVPNCRMPGRGPQLRDSRRVRGSV